MEVLDSFLIDHCEAELEATQCFLFMHADCRQAPLLDQQGVAH